MVPHRVTPHFTESLNPIKLVGIPGRRKADRFDRCRRVGFVTIRSLCGLPKDDAGGVQPPLQSDALSEEAGIGPWACGSRKSLRRHSWEARDWIRWKS